MTVFGSMLVAGRTAIRVGGLKVANDGEKATRIEQIRERYQTGVSINGTKIVRWRTCRRISVPRSSVCWWLSGR